MGKLFIFLLLIVFNSSCNENKKKAEAEKITFSVADISKANSKIVEFLKDTIDKSFILIPQKGLFKVDSSFNSILNYGNVSSLLDNYLTEVEVFDSLYNIFIDNNYIYKNNLQKQNDSLLINNQYNIIKSKINSVLTEIKGFKKLHIGWKVDYQFQIKDDLNQIKTLNSIFIFDKNFNNITYYDDNSLDPEFKREEIIEEFKKILFEKKVQLLKFNNM